MDPLKLLKKKLKKMKASINGSIQASIKENDNILIDQQTEQFDDGQDANGVNFVPSYSATTIGLKQIARQPHNRVTLKDTGDLYDSIAIEANKRSFTITQNVPYFVGLLEIYEANTILGIQPEAMKDFVDDYTVPEITKKFRKIIREQ